MKPVRYLDYQRSKWEGVRRYDAPDPAPGFEAAGRTIGSTVSYGGYRGPRVESAPRGWMALGDVISIPPGRWVDMVTRASNVYGERRGVRAGARVRLPSGVMGKVAFVPRTTCADIGRAFGGGGWAAQMAKEGFARPSGPVGSGITSGIDPFASRLIMMQSALRFQCTDPNIEYPLNDEFWLIVRRLAIELDSRKAIPSTWDVVVESVEEAWDDFVDKIPSPDFPSLGFGLGKLMLYSAIGFGAYLLLKGKR